MMSAAMDRYELVDALAEQRSGERAARDDQLRRELEQVDQIAATVAESASDDSRPSPDR